MKKTLIILMTALLAGWFMPSADACTNLIVGKAASADGSVICSYNADSYGAFFNLAHYPAATHKPGDMREIRDWDTNKYLGKIPEAAVTYNVIGNMNEYQLCIGETTYGGREEMVDSTGIIDYGSLIYITLQRSKNAREAIRVMTSLVETYGYYSEGETFTICDPDEAWIMEMQGKGAGSKGVVWVAMRIPDDCICAHANQSRIRVFPQAKKLNKKQNWYEVEGQCIYSADCIKYARQQGWFNGKDSEFSWADTYAPADFGGRRYCDARVWSFFNRFSDDFSEYLPWAMGKDPDAKPMPLWIKANKKLSVQDVQAAMRDHYEGTAMSLDREDDPGQGLWDMPYRPTPLSFDIDGKKYFNERPISTQQTGFSYVTQLRSWLPRQIGGLMWFGNDDGNMVAYTPVYCSMTVRPECYNTPGADDIHFSDKNAFWVCNMVSNMVYPRYSMLFPELKAVRDRLEKEYFEKQEFIETSALEIMNKDGEVACAKFLNDYSVKVAQSMLQSWKDLAVFIIVKYNDMAVKPDTNGKFDVNAEGLGATVKRPGYTQRARRQIQKQTGDFYAIPE